MVLLGLRSSASSAISASSPSRLAQHSSLRDDPYLTVPFISRSTTPGASSLLAAGSPGPHRRPPSTSSPNPQTLPALPKFRAAWDSLSSSPEYRKTESSTYYTTAWGSPYATPSPRRPSWSLSPYAGRGRESGDSSPASMQSGHYRASGANNTDSLRFPAPTQLARRLYSSLGRDLLGRQGGKSIKDFTEDWINQYLSGQPRTERTNWLSDDSSSEAPSFFTARNHLSEDPSDGWLGLDDDPREDEDSLKTPTVADFAGRNARTEDRGTGTGRRRSRHVSQESTDTLRPEDFWGFAYDKDPRPPSMSDNKDTRASVEGESKQKPVSPVDKPLPPPPPEEEAIKGDDASAPKPAEGSDQQTAAKQTVTGSSSFQRPRKRVVWRGKACIIAVPLEDQRGSPESGYRLLTSADIEERLKRWEEQGYDTRGFSVCTPENPFEAVEDGAFSRPDFPDPVELREEWKARKYRINFPNQAEWDAYVTFLKEEKLRALGVTMGGDDPPPSISPATLPLNRISPQFPGLIASPPIPTSSAASNPLLGGNLFSPHFNHSANTGANIANIASLASPAPQFGAQPAFFGADQNLATFPFQFRPTPPQGSLPPQSFFNVQPAGVASTLAGNLPNLTSILSPASPSNAADDSHAFHPGLNDVLGARKDGRHDQQQNGIPRNQRPQSTKNERNMEPERFQASSNVEIAQPTPRGHGKNVSETLQKGLDRLDQAEYHLEESIQRQLEEDDRESSQNRFNRPDLLNSRWAIPEKSSQPAQKSSQLQKQGSFSQQQHHRLFGEQHADDSGRDGSEISTNPSLSGTPHGQEPAANHAPWHEPKNSTSPFAAGHKPRTSMSGLNVEAKEFDPTGTFSPTNFDFQGNNFQASGFDSAPIFSPTSIFNPAVPSTRSFNVAAPDFTPSTRQENTFSGRFTFSAASFNVEAPVFNPGSGMTAGTGSEAAGSSKSKIFGDIDFSQISKPAKRSKAIPIVRPDDSERDKNKAKKEDDANGSGAGARQKRVRRGGEDGDKEPELAQPLAEAVQTQLPQVPGSAHAPAEGKENAAPGKERFDPLDEKPAPVTAEHRPAESKGTSISEATTLKSFEISNGSGAEADAPLENKKSERDIVVSEEANSATAPDKTSQPAKEHSNETKNSVLSPTAKPFEFKPAAAEFVPAQKTASEPPAKKKPEGLMASRYAVISPPASPENETKPPVPPKDTKPVDKALPPTPGPQADYPDQDAERDSPDERELDAVMERLNGDDPDIGVERLSTPRPAKKAPGSAAEQSAGPQRGPVSGQSVNNKEHTSDWDDSIFSGEGEKVAKRSGFFDTHVTDVVGAALKERLNPLEQTLSVIQHTITSIASRSASRRPARSVSADIENSDADDEDEEGESAIREKSPLARRDRKLDRLKSVFLEALAVHQSSQPERATTVPNPDLKQLQESIAELKALALSQQNARDQTSDLKKMIEEAVSTQFRLNARSSESDEIAESLKLQLDGLKHMLRLADERADQQYRAQRDAQEALAEVQKLLKIAEDDAARHREAAQAAEESLRRFKEEKIPQFEEIQRRSDLLAEQQESLQLTLSELSTKNISLEGTLDEYRVSNDQWKHELEEVKAENKELRSTINHLKLRIEDSMRARQNLRGKFDRLQEDMITATRDIAREQAAWRKRDEEQNARYNALRAAYEREVKLREKLEMEISELEQQEREAAKLKFIFGQSQQENARLEELVATLRQENHEYQLKAARFEREFNEARESTRIEVQRATAALEADVEAAHHQVNIVRAELEAQISRLQSQLDSARMDAATARERYEQLLAEAKEAKQSAVAAALESKEAALEEQRQLHERALNDLRERHARALHNASEDRQRAEAHLTERLALSEAKVQHLKDRVEHLEEKLEIAKSAARAAAQAAQTAKGASHGAAPPSHPTSPSMSLSNGTGGPDKISPQALRESIMVLQDQLQQREARIEELEQQLAAVDRDAPNKLKEKDTEINWLRELLGVRVDDLQDLIDTLSQPSFDRNAVRDAAIRLKANLQMQQQEQERAMAGGGPSFPSLSSISSLAVSPRSLPLAAAAAWGSWRKARENSVTSNPSEQTPSKSNGTGGFLSGLLTPPSSTVRPTPANATASAGGRRYGASRPSRGLNSQRPLSTPQTDTMPAQEPSTPPLLRKSSYDHDAEPHHYPNGAFVDDGEDADVAQSPRGAVDGPFGPRIS